MIGMPLIRQAIVTCVIYVGLVILVEVASSLLVPGGRQDKLFVVSSARGYLFFGTLWMMAFSASNAVEYWLVRIRLQ